MRRRPDAAAIAAAAHHAGRSAAGATLQRPQLAAAVRTTLSLLAQNHPGKSVEVRVPPFGAVQVGVDGPSGAHTRGTPSNVVETDPATWLALASGRLTWADALDQRRLSASGVHSDLTLHLAMLARELSNAVADPRPPSPHEHAMIEHLLSASHAPDALWDQREGLLVRPSCACGCPTLDLVPSAAPADVPDGEIGASTPDALVLLFVRGGLLDRLELAPLDEGTPAEFPPVSSLTTPDAWPGR